MPIVLGHPSDETLRRIAAEAKLLEFSHAEVGMTTRASTARAASSFRFDDWTIDLGEDAETFERSCEALRKWQAHREVMCIGSLR